MQPDDPENTLFPPAPAEDLRLHGAVERLLDRLDRLDGALRGAEAALHGAPDALAALTDAADETFRRASTSGIDLDDRLRSALRLAERLTAPETLRVLSELTARIGRLEALLQLADRLPGFVALAADALDEAAGRAIDAGFDPEASVRRAAEAARKVNALLVSPEFRALMDSGVLEPAALELVGGAGRALVAAHGGEPERAGALDLFRALRDPDVRRALGFAVRFARHFGRTLNPPA